MPLPEPFTERMMLALIEAERLRKSAAALDTFIDYFALVAILALIAAAIAVGFST
jgi:hypothetical protein